MDSGQFDNIARRLGVALTRRGTLGALLGGFAAFLLPASEATGPVVAAKRRHRPGARNRRGGVGRDTKRGSRRGTPRDKPRKNSAQKARAEATRCCATGNCTPGKGKNLQKCCYQGQNLSGKNFQGANLSSATFSGATLTGANVQGANLGKACFVDADLRGVRFPSSTNLDGAIYCRTQTDSGENNAGCDAGTDCCATCDAAHPCGDGFVCCAGRCVAGNCCDNSERSTCNDGQICCGHSCVDGDCCQGADCPAKTCERRACLDNHCVYTPVAGEPGPRCQTVCCEDAQGDPVCCDAGVELCQPSGRCGCGRDADCGTDQRCCAGLCVARTTCCEGNNAEGCAGELHCCVLNGTGLCRACCNADQCPDETCETKSCGANGTCAYTPVFGDDGPGCTTVCCENANEQPVCCPDGTTVCTASGRCRCEGAADCAANQLCCNGSCIANTLCCDGNPGTCPAPGVCQERACNGATCQPRGVTGGTCPFPSGGTGECSNGTCACPSPRVTCSDGCCPSGVIACGANGACGPVCDVCPSGCRFSTLAAAVAGTPADGTIRICPGAYATNTVTIDKNLTIGGAGSGSDPAVDTILSGGNTSRVLTILQATVTMQDLTVTGGKGADRCGGIEVVLDATLNLERVELVGNTSDVSGTGPNSGGGLNVFAGSTAVIKSSRIANNTTQGGGSAVGGGIYNGGTLTVESTTIELNTARGGGGIFNGRGSRLTLNPGAVITQNTATQPIGSLGPLGSGIYNLGTIIDNDPGTNVFGNTPATNQCVNEAPGTGCPA